MIVYDDFDPSASTDDDELTALLEWAPPPVVEGAPGAAPAVVGLVVAPTPTNSGLLAQLKAATAAAVAANGPKAILKAILQESAIPSGTGLGEGLHVLPRSMESIQKLQKWRIRLRPSQIGALPALVLPYHDAAGTLISWRVRYLGDDIPVDHKGREKKYVGPSNVHALYVPTLTRRFWDQSDTLWVVEGERKALAVLGQAEARDERDGQPIGVLEYVVVGIGGIKSAVARDGQLFPELADAARSGKRIVLCPDGDRAVNPDVGPATNRLAMQLMRLQAEAGVLEKVKLVRIPGDAKIDDYLAGKRPREHWAALRALRQDDVPLTDEERAELRKPQINLSEKSDTQLAKLQAVLSGVDTLLRQGGGVVEVLADGQVKDWDLHTLQYTLPRWASFVQAKGSKKALEDAPIVPLGLARAVCGSVHAWGQELKGVLTAPAVGPDHKLMWRPGLDRATGLWLAGDGGRLGCLSVEDAKRVYGVLLGDFIFVEEHHKSVFLALILTVLLRPAIDGATPGFVFEAPSRAGKSLLVKLAATISTWIEHPQTSGLSSNDKEEARKQFTGALLRGGRLFFFDDLEEEGAVDFSELRQYMTNRSIGSRLLYNRRDTFFETTGVVVFTGISAMFGSQMTRRLLRCSITEQYDKNFKISDIEAACWKHRRELLGAAWSLFEAWRKAGSPPGPLPLGGYREWNVVRSVLLWAGYPDPAASQQELQTDVGSFEELYQAVAALLRSRPGWEPTASALLCAATWERVDDTTPEAVPRYKCEAPELAQAIKQAFGRSRISSEALGRKLRSLAGAPRGEGGRLASRMLDGTTRWRWDE